MPAVAGAVEPVEQLAGGQGFAAAQLQGEAVERVGRGHALHERLHRGHQHAGLAFVSAFGGAAHHGDALGQQFEVDGGLAGQDLQSAEAFEGEVAPAVFTAQRFQVVERVVGFVEVGDHQQHGAVEGAGGLGGQQRGERAAHAGGHGRHVGGEGFGQGAQGGTAGDVFVPGGGRGQGGSLGLSGAWRAVCRGR